PNTEASTPTNNATPQEVINPIVNPVTTENGLEIVSTENGQPIVKNTDGTTRKVTPKEVGAELQKDGTLKVKGKDGKMKVLPHTGEKENALFVLVGTLLAATSSYVLKRKV
ncbi:LPXTG cell wall anchor domain-containing protein, partial [Enterococcus faecalis]